MLKISVETSFDSSDLHPLHPLHPRVGSKSFTSLSVMKIRLSCSFLTAVGSCGMCGLVIPMGAGSKSRSIRLFKHDAPGSMSIAVPLLVFWTLRLMLRHHTISMRSVMILTRLGVESNPAPVGHGTSVLRSRVVRVSGLQSTFSSKSESLL